VPAWSPADHDAGKERRHQSRCVRHPPPKIRWRRKADRDALEAEMDGAGANWPATGLRRAPTFVFRGRNNDKRHREREKLMMFYERRRWPRVLRTMSSPLDNGA